MKIKKERTIVINESFTIEMGGEICLEIYELSQTSKEDINIIINSFGGSIKALRTILNGLKASGCKINTILIGTVAFSCGAILFLSGDERIILEGSELLLHEPGIDFSTEETVTYTKLQQELREIKKDKKLFLEIIMKSSNFTRKVINEKIKGKDWYISSSEALKFGMATELIYSFDEIAEDKE